MGTLLFIVIIIAVLCAIKVPAPKAPTSDGLTEARRRQLIKAGRRASKRNRGGLPWFRG